MGPQKVAFSIHMSLLCNTSPYFRAAFKGGFYEGASRTLELPEEDVDVFEHFQLWLYSGSILEKHEQAKDIIWDVLIALWIFGESRGIPELQNTAMDTLIDKTWEMHTLKTHVLPVIYESTPDKSALRQFHIDWMTHKANLTQWLNVPEGPGKDCYPKQFLFDLSMSLYERSRGTKPVVTDFRTVRSNYHVKALPENPNGQATITKQGVSPLL